MFSLIALKIQLNLGFFQSLLAFPPRLSPLGSLAAFSHSPLPSSHSLPGEGSVMLGEKRRGRRMAERRRITTKPGLTLLIGLLKRTALKAEAHVGRCHGTHQGDGSSLPKMAVLLLGRPAAMNLSGAPSFPPSFLNLELLSAPAGFIYMLEPSSRVQVVSVFRSEGKQRCGSWQQPSLS